MHMFGSAGRLAQARLLSRISSGPQTPLPNDVQMVKRKEIVTERVSKRSGLGGKGVKAKQAWKYSGFEIVRAPGLLLNGRLYTDPKEDPPGDADAQGTEPRPEQIMGTPRRKQESNFFITLNPNREFKDKLAPEAMTRFEAALKKLAENETLELIIKFGPVHKHYANDKAEDVLIPGASFTASVEVGDVMKRMHAHAWLTIEHYSQIQINLNMLRSQFVYYYNQGLPLGDPLRLTRAPYLQVKLLPQSDWTTIMRQYIKKGMMGA